MASQPRRDPVLDHLLTPENSVIAFIDYQPTQIESIKSMDQQLMVRNAVSVARLAVLYRVPVILSTVNVSNGRNAPTINALAGVLAGVGPLDRTTINAWEDTEFVEAIKATGRRKLVLAALWTEACLAFPTLDAIRDGYEVYPVVDAIGGTSVEAHRAGLDRVTQAGAHLTSVPQLACELQRDWSRVDTAAGFAQILFHSSDT